MLESVLYRPPDAWWETVLGLSLVSQGLKKNDQRMNLVNLHMGQS